jgi:hypothetical protein
MSNRSINLLRITRTPCPNLLLLPQTSAADSREEEHDTANTLASIYASLPNTTLKDRKKRTHHIAMLKPQTLFASKQTPLLVPTQLR